MSTSQLISLILCCFPLALFAQRSHAPLDYAQEDDFKLGKFVEAPEHLARLYRLPAQNDAKMDTVYLSVNPRCPSCQKVSQEKAAYSIDHSDVFPVIRYHTEDNGIYLRRNTSATSPKTTNTREDSLLVSRTVSISHCGHDPSMETEKVGMKH